MKLTIIKGVEISLDEMEFSAIRAQGPGGQHVNKSATAVQLRFDIKRSSLPDFYKRKLLALGDNRISREGIILIKAQEYRSQFRNKEAALQRLAELMRRAFKERRKRKATMPTAASKKKRLESKTKRSEIKRQRAKIKTYD